MAVEAPNLLAESGLPIVYATGPGADGPDAPEDGDVAMRTIVRSLTVMQKEALVMSNRSDHRWRLASDEGPYLAGHDFAPAPLAHMTVGFAADLTAAVGRVAPHLSSLRLDTYFGMKGSMRARTMTGSARSPEVTVRLAGSSPGVDAAIRNAVRTSVTAALARDVKTSRFTLTSHGRTIPVGRVAGAGEGTPADPGSAPESPEPITSDAGIVVKTRDVAESPSDAGVSLQERQDRGLHLQAEAHPRSDGLVEVELRLLSPSGSTFTFLTEEPGDGPARAPDALTYISAGLGFCFMTQIGRFAKIVKEDLGSYHIVQDTRFRQARDGAPAHVSDPVTHVFLEPSGDDDFARDALDMSEQTCFLHAFCRTPLDVSAQVESV